MITRKEKHDGQKTQYKARLVQYAQLTILLEHQRVFFNLIVSLIQLVSSSGILLAKLVLFLIAESTYIIWNP